MPPVDYSIMTFLGVAHGFNPNTESNRAPLITYLLGSCKKSMIDRGGNIKGLVAYL
jgi:hypothetical protein